MPLTAPHGKLGKLSPLLLEGGARDAELARANSLPRIMMSSREVSDVLMMGIGAFTPLQGFMSQRDHLAVCEQYQLAGGTFWPIPITLSVGKQSADGVRDGQDVALCDEESGQIVATMQVQERYAIDKNHECQSVFRTTDPKHPGVAKVMAQGELNLAGTVKVLSEGDYPERFAGLYLRPAQARAQFEKLGWSRVAALQLRNPMHRSHEYLAKIAVEVCDGVFIHQILGKLKGDDIPASVRVRAVDVLVRNYFVDGTALQAGYPMEMRYAGPREALLHALIRQNFGCSHMIIGRDHAGVGSYYGPLDAQKIFDEIPGGSLRIQPLKIDWTWFCRKCRTMASARTCPDSHKDARLMLSGTALRAALAAGQQIDPDFSRPEVLEVLAGYYKDLVESSEHGRA